MPRRVFSVLFSLSIVLSGMLVAGEPDSDPNATLAEYFRHETARVSAAALDDVNSLEDWKARRGELHRQLADMLGLDPLPKRTPLNAKITGTIEGEDVIVEKLRFESRPGLYVTGNLWRPREQSEPLPGILYVCGHAKVKENGISYGNKTHYQHHGAWFARNGYVCLIIDTLQLGEIEGLHHGVFPRALKASSTPDHPVYDTHWWWYSRGYTPAGVETWNGMRAIDYLQSREEVDSDRIGVTGRSGGGAYSWFIAAMDDRVKAAVPVAGITDLENHVVDDCIEGHCDCMFFTNFYQWDFPLLPALIAPRPLLTSNTDKDRIFPLDGVVRTQFFARKIYQLYGADKKLGIHVTEGPHQDTQELRIGAFVWFDRFLKDKRQVVKDAGEKPFTPEELKVLDEIPEDEKNTTIDETFVSRAATPEVPKSQEEWQALRTEWEETLAKTTFSGWPQNADTPAVKLVETTRIDDATIHEYRVTTQAPFELPLYVVIPEGVDKSAAVEFQPVDQAGWHAFAVAAELINSKKKDSEAIETWRDRIAESQQVLAIFAPRGIGPSAWTDNPKERVHIRRRFMLLGQTLAGMRAWDIRQALGALPAIDSVANRPVKLTASGSDATTWALHALVKGSASLEGLALIGLPADYHNAPELLVISQILNVPQTLAIIAEQSPVTIKTDDPQAWEWTRTLAKRLDWPGEQLVITPGN